MCGSIHGIMSQLLSDKQLVDSDRTIIGRNSWGPGSLYSNELRARKPADTLGNHGSDVSPAVRSGVLTQAALPSRKRRIQTPGSGRWIAEEEDADEPAGRECSI